MISLLIISSLLLAYYFIFIDKKEEVETIGWREQITNRHSNVINEIQKKIPVFLEPYIETVYIDSSLHQEYIYSSIELYSMTRQMRFSPTLYELSKYKHYIILPDFSFDINSAIRIEFTEESINWALEVYNNLEQYSKEEYELAEKILGLK